MILILSAFTVFCLLVPVYVIAGYPVFLFFASKLFRKRVQADSSYVPSVTIIISCYNEADVIEKKIDNVLKLDYPSDRFRIIFVSDCSDDGTDEIILKYTNEQLKLVRQDSRQGKTSGLNLALADVDTEITVFSDANAMYAADAIRNLVRHFTDSSVGYVVGAALYTNAASSSAAYSENLYWRYELAIKKWESDLHSVVGGDGAIYAIRTRLYEPLDARDINDFVNPLQIITKGYRGIFDPEAICHEEAAGSFDKESNRKERIVNRSFRGLMNNKAVMNPLRFGWFSWEIISHKLLRWLIPFFLAGFGIGVLTLGMLGIPFFQLIMIFMLLGLCFALMGYWLSGNQRQWPVLYIPYYFVRVNYRSILGVISALRGNIQVTWASARTTSTATDTPSLKSILLSALPFVIMLYIIVTSCIDLAG